MHMSKFSLTNDLTVKGSGVHFLRQVPTETFELWTPKEDSPENPS